MVMATAAAKTARYAAVMGGCRSRCIQHPVPATLLHKRTGQDKSRQHDRQGDNVLRPEPEVGLIGRERQKLFKRGETSGRTARRCRATMAMPKPQVIAIPASNSASTGSSVSCGPVGRAKSAMQKIANNRRRCRRKPAETTTGASFAELLPGESRTGRPTRRCRGHSSRTSARGTALGERISCCRNSAESAHEPGCE